MTSVPPSDVARAAGPTRPTVVMLTSVISLVLAVLTVLWVLGTTFMILANPGVPSALAALTVLFGGTLLVAHVWAAVCFRRAQRAVPPPGGTAPTPDGFASPAQRTNFRTGRRLLMLAALFTAPSVLAGAWITNDMGADAQMIASWYGLMAACTTAISVALVAREMWSWTLLAATVGAQIASLLLSHPTDPTKVTHVVLLTVTASCFVIAAVSWLKLLATFVDRALRDSSQEVARVAAQTAAVTEASRIDGLVHDHILAALLLASRADDPEDAPFIRRSSASALAALSEIQAPQGAVAARQDGGVDVTELAGTLLRKVRAEDPSIVFSGRGRREADVPEEVATALVAAALEAVRNSLRHAGTGVGRPVRRLLTLSTSSNSLTVKVSDDGVGFDLSQAPKGRYGVTGSILGRMEALEGGLGRIDTAPGQGTTVVLTWTDPRAHGDDDARSLDDITAEARERGPLDELRDTSHSISPEMRYLRQFASSLHHDLPMGATMRGTIGVGLGLTAMAVHSLQFFDPWWPNFAALGACIVWVAYLLHLWRLDSTADPPTRMALAMGLTAPAALVATLVSWQGSDVLQLRLWTMALTSITPVLLSLSNFPVISWISSLTSGAVYVTWTLLVQGTAGLTSLTWAMFILIPWALNSIQRSALGSISTAAAVSAAHRADIDAQARENASLSARRTRGLRVDALARPLLERLAAGERTELSVRLEAAQLEAHLRDDLRGRCFRDTEVTRAAHDARRAGVRVELLDDGALDDASERLREEVVDSAVEALDSAESGAVIIRVAPPGRDVVATIVSSPADRPSTRLEIHPELRMLAATAADGGS